MQSERVCRTRLVEISLQFRIKLCEILSSCFALGLHRFRIEFRYHVNGLNLHFILEIFLQLSLGMNANLIEFPTNASKVLTVTIITLLSLQWRNNCNFHKLIQMKHH